jgi:hypothetical protein
MGTVITKLKPAEPTIHVGMRFTLKGYHGVSEVTKIDGDVVYFDLYDGNSVRDRLSLLLECFRLGYAKVVEPKTDAESPAPQSLHPCSSGHRPEHWVNVGFYTATYACKHCGCDKTESKRLINVDDLVPGEVLLVKHSWNGVVPGTRVTVSENDGWDVTVIHSTSYGDVSFMIPIAFLNDYFEFPADSSGDSNG